ncbi:DUF5610 domain-containing protein [Alteromonas ponticola]|uniref:DUF5610 domain-containing protein n=1 Tax=Alteromonas aquimaris TaxID=2998417 RepID=A0ABT3P4X6_9ALTE|nr:DUF5610 domain-containing protein [Alteromonas aquimaris]MCW8107161.1 DUF5610 domain-containing protein [Alteromonas aquimaris]
MQAVAFSQNFGQQVHQLKATRAEEGTTGPLGKDVSAMAHARNAERQAEKNATERTNATDQVELNITDSANTDAAVTTIVTHNINEFLQSANETSSSVTLRPATADESLSDLIRTGFSSLLASYQEQNPEQSAEESLNNFTKLMHDGVEKGFSEAHEALANGNTLDEESINRLSASKDQIRNLISELASAVSTSGL